MNREKEGLQQLGKKTEYRMDSIGCSSTAQSLHRCARLRVSLTLRR